MYLTEKEDYKYDAAELAGLYQNILNAMIEDNVQLVDNKNFVDFIADGNDSNNFLDETKAALFSEFGASPITDITALSSALTFVFDERVFLGLESPEDVDQTARIPDDSTCSAATQNVFESLAYEVIDGSRFGDDLLAMGDFLESVETWVEERKFNHGPDKNDPLYIPTFEFAPPAHH